jgi:hypothetical protein
MTEQPSWWCVANIGDADPYEHDGGFVLVDRRGVYAPELILIESFDDSGSRRLWNIVLDPLIVVKNGDIRDANLEVGRREDNWIGLNDNKYHPDGIAWFGDWNSLQSVAGFIGRDPYSFVRTLLSNDPVDRALGYKALADYHGTSNFDQYPETLTEEKAELMCSRFLKQIEESESWHDGYFGD